MNPAHSSTSRGAAVGAGTLVSADGLILTIASLFETPGDIIVTLDSGERIKASLVGQDRHTGLALLKVDRTNVPFLRVTAPQGLALGERVIALGRTAFETGSPLVVTDGIVSSTWSAGMGVASFIQATVQVLPGMGGGPLIRLKTGELVGVVSQQYVQRVGMSITFATPIEVYLGIATELRSRGQVARAAIGISANVLSEEDSRRIGLPVKMGVILTGIRDSGPAQKAGLQVGDVVLAVEGKEPTSAPSLFELIRSKPPGSRLEVQIFRRGVTQTIHVTSEAVSGA
ncbi:S1C family serine protease [Paracidovorax sp. MALMAid1276]|uniref:S1C family serine protease n=1 Tax=Paracidovorax sp. MALMAid1276 TaxID=3411631 RepID=UPI003BA31680